MASWCLLLNLKVTARVSGRLALQSAPGWPFLSHCRERCVGERNSLCLNTGKGTVSKDRFRGRLAAQLFSQMGLSEAKTQVARKEGRREDGCTGGPLGMWYPDLESRPPRYAHSDWSPSSSAVTLPTHPLVPLIPCAAPLYYLHPDGFESGPHLGVYLRGWKLGSVGTTQSAGCLCLCNVKASTQKLSSVLCSPSLVSLLGSYHNIY